MPQQKQRLIFPVKNSETGQPFDCGITFYSIDQHFPTPKNSYFFPGEEFISTMKHGVNDLGTPRRYLRDDQVNPPYRIPYRCLYSRNVDNLFMAGRNSCNTL